MRIKNFVLMPFKDKAMFFINFIFCGIARALTKLCNYKRLLPYFGHSCQMLKASTLITNTDVLQVKRIRRSISLAAKYTPWKSNCLTQAMVAVFWCKYYKLPYLFFIGLAKKSDNPFTDEAHAWVTSGPIAITGEHSFNSHEVISTFSNSIINNGCKNYVS